MAMLGTMADLMLVVFGFGLIVFAHELGHFLAARWAGVRVLAFALGFGPAIASYRRGLGWRRGSSEAEYRRRAAGSAGSDAAAALSPTEYRINWLPFGGYVKMLGQEDANPTAASSAPDSYQSRPIWKRMVVISAGVVVNVLLALVLFIVVFMAGLPTEPAVVGDVREGSPAARAAPDHPTSLGVGLRPGDEVLSINGSVPNHFNDVLMKVATAPAGSPVRVVVRREGAPEPLRFSAIPEPSPLTGLLDLGFEPPRTLTIDPSISPSDWAIAAPRLGLAGVEPGMRMVRAGEARGLTRAAQFEAAVASGGGAPVDLEFTSEQRSVVVVMTPQAELELADADGAPDVIRPVEHLLGLRGLMRVVGDEGRGREQGLRDGDLFTRVGAVEYPSVEQGIAEIRRHAGREIALSVLRHADGATQEFDLTASVRRDGTIGFGVSTTERESTLLSEPLSTVWPMLREGAPRVPAAAGAFTPGLRILAVESRPVASFTELRDALRDATRDAIAGDAQQAPVRLVVESAVGRGRSDAPPPEREIEWVLQREDLIALHALGWEPTIPAALFEPEEFVLRATGPVHAVTLGVEETQRMLARTYLTLARLAQGSVRVEHLQGPVGIAHVGTRIADRGVIWLTFFLALLSINLAVINFLPLPIVDGGQFLMLLYEQLRGRPVPLAIQGAITMAGLALIGTLFLVVTFNDVSRLLDVLRGP